MARIWCSNIINTITIFGVQMSSPFYSAEADDFVFLFFFTQNWQFCNLGKYELLPVLLPSFRCQVKVKVAQSCLTLQPHGLYCPWNSPGQNSGVGSLSLLKGIFPTQGLTQVSHTAGWFSTSWATREAHFSDLNKLFSGVQKALFTLRRRAYDREWRAEWKLTQNSELQGHGQWLF